MVVVNRRYNTLNSYYTELYFLLLLCTRVKLGLSQCGRNRLRVFENRVLMRFLDLRGRNDRRMEKIA